MRAEILVLSGVLCAGAWAAYPGEARAGSQAAAREVKPSQAARTAQVASAKTTPDTMSSFDFAVGKLRCNGLTPAGKVDYTFTQEISKLMNGHWFRSRDATGEGTGEAFWTFDAKGHAWHYISIEDSGGYAIGSSRGWVANQQTWTGYSYSNGTRRSWGRIVLKKVSDREKREDFYAPGKGGRLSFVGSEICTKMD
jgi:hypothetical protein